MQTARIAIIGAGLRGLYAAFLLEQQGIRNYVLLEAREAIGGRITSIPASGHSPDDTAAGGNINRFDLGPTWFWPGFQGELDQLVSDLGLARFAQHEDGNMMVERSLIEAPMRMRGFVNSPASMHLVGGMAALTDALHRRLEPARIITGQVVRHLRRIDNYIEVDSEDAA